MTMNELYEINMSFRKMNNINAEMRHTLIWEMVYQNNMWISKGTASLN